MLCTQIGYCNTDMDLNNVRRWGGQEVSLESYRSNVEWARSKRHKVNKGILSNNNCRGEEAFIVSFFFFGKYENKATSGRIGGQRTRSASKLARRMRTTGSLLSARSALVVLEEMGQTRRMEMEAPTVGRSQPR